MKGNPPANVPPTRVSARIVARQISNTPAWITPTTTNGEKRLLQALLDYLHDSADSIAVLQYLTKEFRPIAATLHTIPTIRKVRSRLWELEVTYLRYDRAQKKWQYWNDFTEAGRMEKDKLTMQEASTAAGLTPCVVPTGKNEAENGTEATNVEATTTGDQQLAPTSPDPLETSNKQQKIALLDPPADKDPPAATLSPDPSPQTRTEACNTTTLSQQTRTQSPSVLTTPDRREGAPSAWFQSPPKIRNPYTGRMVQAPTPPRLQAMIQELQNHEDWFEEPAATVQTTATVAPMDNPTATTMDTKPRRNSPPVDEDGFITVLPSHGGHQRLTPARTIQTSTATPVQNRYHALMEEAMETLTAHARGLETMATERHQARIDQAKVDLQLALDAAIAKIQQVTEKQCATQKETLGRYCDEQVESLIADLDNFSGQAHQIQQEILNGVRDGTQEARTVPIEDDEDTPQTVSTADQARTINPTPSVPGRRFSNVDYQEIMSGRNPPPPMPSKATATSDVPEEKYSNTEYQLLRLRAASTPTQLRSHERKAVIKFYNGFVDFVRQYGVPVKTFDQLHIEHLEDPQMTVYPADTLTATSPVYLRYSAAIYARLEEDGILDPKEPTYSGLLQMYNRTRDGYTLLKSILAATLTVEAKNLSLLSTPPPVESTAHPFEFASQLQEFFQCQTKYQRHYTEREQVIMFLQGMQQVRRYALSAAQLVHDLEQQPATGSLAHRLGFLQIPITLDSHPATLPMPSTPDAYAPARLNVTRANADTRTSPTARSSTSGRRDGNAPRNTRRGARPTKDVQCPACATYGHELADCKVLPKLAACLDYIQTHTSMVQTTLQKYRHTNHPQNRQSRQNTREVLANRLYGHLSAHTSIPDVHGLVDDITASLLGSEDEDADDDDADNSANICHIQATPLFQNPRERLTMTPQPARDWHTHEVLHPTDAIQPVKFPLLQQILDEEYHSSSPLAPPRADDVAHHTSITVSVSAVQQRDLADTGASVSATGLRHILHDFTADTRYEITGYDGTVTKAAGEGYALVHNHATATTDRILFVYAPTITGTIFSLEHHAQTHPRIHRWSQEAIPSTQGGWITFYDNRDSIVSRYPTVRSKGVYYIQDMKFISTTETGVHQEQQTTTPASDGNSTILSLHAIETDKLADFTYSGMTETFADYVQVPTTTPIVTSIYQAINSAMPSMMETDILNFEVWHQRLAHCSEQKLRKTQRHVDGIPAFRQSTLPPFVRCRACDVATLKKAPRGPTTTTPRTLHPGQVLHMDLGFFRGPSNLAEVYERQAPPSPKIVESRQGFVCYLLIIDRCTRYIWIFPLRSKSVPPELIRIFLQTHGNPGQMVKTLRTDGEGSLAESPKFRQILMEYGYTLEKTAPDTSSQNGLAERPHRTLGEMTRCLLYSAAMPIYFWADAMVYSGYIHNRLYHEGAQGVPYNLWTGKRANVKHLRTFGSRVLVKRSGARSTKGDPHHFDGRFLRFGATDRNIIYFDEVTQREKVARHCTIDEFHYGSGTRPPGAQQVLGTTTPQVLLRQHPPRDVGYLIEDEKTPLPNTPIDTLDPMLAERHHGRTPNAATAAAAFGALTRPEQQMEEILHAWTDLNSYLPMVPIRLPLNRHPTLGLILVQDADQPLVYLQGCHMGTYAYRLPRWRSTIRHSVLRTLNGHRVTSIAQLQQLLEDHRAASGQFVDLEFAKVEPRVQPDTDIPHLHFDQLRHINQLHVAMRTEQGLPPDPVFLSLTRSQLKKRNDYDIWRKSEWKQHDKYKAQDMFGPPCPRPRDAIVLPFVWTYMLKEDPVTGEPIFKARGTCNGGKRYGKVVTLAETYATCVEQPACRLYWSLTASEGLLAMGADAGNAFAEAPPPIQPFYMIIDDQFAEWWTESEGNPPIPEGYVLPVQHALQGHPEAPRLWEQHIHRILTEELKFRSTTHEKCLYSRNDPVTTELQLLLRQVDDFSVSATDQQACTAIIQAIGAFLKVPLNDLGLIRKFNGVNVTQTRWYIKISCQDYLLKILENHGWLELQASTQPIPMRNDSAYQRQLELAERPATARDQEQLQKQVGYSYRAAVGELIYALVIARPEISLSTTKLSQYGTNPARVHYDAVKAIFAFLNNTRDDGLIYWRQSPRMDLPEAPLPTPHSTSANALPRLTNNPTQPIAFSDSDWGSDFSHRRSISGMIIMLSGAAIVYKTRYQKAVALSSTEAEFVSAADTGKMILYIRSLLHDLGFSQPTPTQLHVDNTGAIFMVEAQAPTKRTRHVDIRYFALLDWSLTGQLKAVPIRTDMNISDSMTKATGRIKFHQHADMFMGRVPPTYVTEAYPAIEPAYIHALAGQQQYPANYLSALNYSPERRTQYWLAFVSESMGG